MSLIPSQEPAPMVMFGEPEPAPEAEPAAKLPVRGRVLAVDDDRVIRHLLLQMLEEDYEVDVAESGQQALAVARRIRPDVIVTGLVMPDGDGWDLINELRRDPTFEEVQIIAISGLDNRPAEILEFGADDFISKPFEQDELTARVGVAISRRSRLSRLHSMLDALPIGVFLAEANGQLLVVSEPLVAMLGYPSPSALCSRRLADLVVDPERRSAVIDAVAGGTSVEIACGLTRADDDLLEVGLTVGPACDEAGAPIGVAGTVHPR